MAQMGGMVQVIMAQKGGNVKVNMAQMGVNVLGNHGIDGRQGAGIMAYLGGKVL